GRRHPRKPARWRLSAGSPVREGINACRKSVRVVLTGGVDGPILLPLPRTRSSNASPLCCGGEGGVRGLGLAHLDAHLYQRLSSDESRQDFSAAPGRGGVCRYANQLSRNRSLMGNPTKSPPRISKRRGAMSECSVSRRRFVHSATAAALFGPVAG